MSPLTLPDCLSFWEEGRIGLYHFLKSKNTTTGLLLFLYEPCKPWVITMLCFYLCWLQQFILFPCVFSVLRMAYVIPPSAPSPAVTMRVFLSLHVVSPAYTLWGNNITCSQIWRMVLGYAWLKTYIELTMKWQQHFWEFFLLNSRCFLPFFSPAVFFSAVPIERQLLTEKF